MREAGSQVCKGVPWWRRQRCPARPCSSGLAQPSLLPRRSARWWVGCRRSAFDRKGMGVWCGREMCGQREAASAPAGTHRPRFVILAATCSHTAFPPHLALRAELCTPAASLVLAWAREREWRAEATARAAAQATSSSSTLEEALMAGWLSFASARLEEETGMETYMQVRLYIPQARSAHTDARRRGIFSGRLPLEPTPRANLHAAYSLPGPSPSYPAARAG